MRCLLFKHRWKLNGYLFWCRDRLSIAYKSFRYCERCHEIQDFKITYPVNAISK